MLAFLLRFKTTLRRGTEQSQQNIRKILQQGLQENIIFDTSNIVVSPDSTIYSLSCLCISEQGILEEVLQEGNNITNSDLYKGRASTNDKG